MVYVQITNVHCVMGSFVDDRLAGVLDGFLTLLSIPLWRSLLVHVNVALKR